MGPWTAEAWRAVGDLIVPPTCVACSAPSASGDPWCPACGRRLHLLRARPACPTCALPCGALLAPDGRCGTCRGRRLPYSHAAAVGAYAGPLSDLVVQLKFQGLVALLPHATAMIKERLQVTAWATRVDRVTCVPAHWTRRWRQPFYLPVALARAAAAHLDCPFVRTAWRPHRPRRQIRLGARDRRHNMRQAFRRLPHVDVAGHTVCLVDDVMTSGATVDAMSRVLRACGAADVVLLVLARSGQ